MRKFDVHLIYKFELCGLDSSFVVRWSLIVLLAIVCAARPSRNWHQIELNCYRVARSWFQGPAHAALFWAPALSLLLLLLLGVAGRPAGKPSHSSAVHVCAQIPNGNFHLDSVNRWSRNGYVVISFGLRAAPRRGDFWSGFINANELTGCSLTPLGTLDETERAYEQGSVQAPCEYRSNEMAKW